MGWGDCHHAAAAVVVVRGVGVISESLGQATARRRLFGRYLVFL